MNESLSTFAYIVALAKSASQPTSISASRQSLIQIGERIYLSWQIINYKIARLSNKCVEKIHDYPKSSWTFNETEEIFHVPRDSSIRPPRGWNHGSVPNVCEIEDIHVYTRARCVSRVGGFFTGILCVEGYRGKFIYSRRSVFNPRFDARLRETSDPPERALYKVKANTNNIHTHRLRYKS